MSERLPQVTAQEVLRALTRDGWYITRQSGHTILGHPSKPGIIPVPRHRRPLKQGTLRSIVDAAGLTPEEFKRLL